MSANKPSLVVGRVDTPAAITVSTGLLPKSIVFPDTGGGQLIDAAGNVLPLVGATGSLIPAADNADDLGQITTPLRWKSGFFGTSVMTPMLTVYVAGVEANVLQLANGGTAVNYWKFTNSATGVAPILNVVGTDADIPLTIAAKGTGDVTITGSALRAPDTDIGSNLRVFDSGADTRFAALTDIGGFTFVPRTTGSIRFRNALNGITVLGVQSVNASAFFGIVAENVQDTAGNAQTINAVSGSFRILTAGAATTFVITNNRVLNAGSVVICTFKRIDATATTISALASNGQFTVTINAAATADTDVSFLVINEST